MIDQVPPELADLIAAESKAPAGDAAASAAIHARVVASASGAAGTIATGKLLALILGIGVVGAVATFAWPRDSSPRAHVRETPAAVVAPEPAPPPPPAITTTAPAPVAALLPSAPPPRARAIRSTPPVTTTAAPALVSTTAAASPPPTEADLLADASHALATGDDTRALALIEQHATLYPSGQLAEERDDLRARTLAAEGRTAEARAAVARFVAAYPHSVYLHALTKDVAP